MSTRSITAPLVLVLVAGCGSLFGLDTPPGVQPDAAVAVPIDAPPIDGIHGYHASAVHFDESGGDYLSTPHLSTQNSKLGTVSVWLRFTAGDGQMQFVSGAALAGAGGVVRTQANRFELLMPACSGAPLLDMRSQAAYTTTSGWIHLLASWDLANQRAQLYINDIPDRAANPTITDGDICYSLPVWGIGGLTSALLDADVADLYAVLDTSLDLDVEANRRLFRDAAGKPVDLGVNCTTPAHELPTGCFIGDPATWNMNRGNGGSFTVSGDGLSPAQSSPSD